VTTLTTGFTTGFGRDYLCVMSRLHDGAHSTHVMLSEPHLLHLYRSVTEARFLVSQFDKTKVRLVTMVDWIWSI
jgi:hypothetical protein